METPKFKSNLEALKSVDHIKEIVIYAGPDVISRIPNEDGKRGSLKVFGNTLGFEDGSITQDDIKYALTQFAEYSDYVIATPEGTDHANVRLLVQAQRKESNSLRGVIRFDIPSGLEQTVLELHSMKKEGKLTEKRDLALDTFNTVMNLLEKGHLRTAQYSEQGWKVNDWVKKGVLLGFPLGANIEYGQGDITFVDKATLPLRKIYPSSGIRVVPPAAGMRRGSYAGQGTILMPPAYVNVGAFVGRGTMVENLVGSCAQVGRDSHISAGAIIGGVLDPIEATPVILGDYVLMGEGSGVTQGTRLGDLVVIAPGVHISKGTQVFDKLRGRVYNKNGTFVLHSNMIDVPQTPFVQQGFNSFRINTIGEQVSEKDPSYGPEIPRGALVVPGIASFNGDLRVAPTIVKYIDDPKKRSYDLNEDLRAK